MTGIYKITSPKNRVYIGQSVNIEKRFNEYRRRLCPKQIRLHKSFEKHGIDSHIFEVVELCDFNDLNKKERYWQDYYKVTSKYGLNCTLTGYDEVKTVISVETRNKIANTLRGHTYNLGRKFTGEKLFNLGKKGRASRGIKVSEETRAKIKLARAKQIITPEHRKNMSEFNGMSRIVLDTETGIFWKSVKEVSMIYNIKQNTLITRLNGYRKNKTQFIYI